jgi:uncharacterized protein YaaW (UPF0174 family)
LLLNAGTYQQIPTKGNNTMNKYFLGLTPSEANNLMFTRLRRSTEQLMKLYNDVPYDNPKELAEKLEQVIGDLSSLKLELNMLSDWQKETLAKLDSKEKAQ